MNYWIFVVKDQKVDDESMKGIEIYNRRMEDEFWGLDENIPYRKILSKGDRVVFYLAAPYKKLIGTADLSTSLKPLDEDDKRKFIHSKILSADYGVKLEKVNIWNNHRNFEDYIDSLEFMENKQNWGAHLTGGISKISEDDFRLLIEFR